jgi:hypothetical protein
MQSTMIMIENKTYLILKRALFFRAWYMYSAEYLKCKVCSRRAFHRTSTKLSSCIRNPWCQDSKSRRLHRHPQQITTTTVETSGSPRRTTPRSYHGGTWVTRLGKRGVRPANRNSVSRGLAWAVTFAPRLCSTQNAVMLRLSSPGDRKISHAHAASGVLSTVEGQRTNERNGLFTSRGNGIRCG